MGLCCCHSLWIALPFLPLAFAQVDSYPSKSSHNFPRESPPPYVLETRQFQLDSVSLIPLTQQLSQPHSDSASNPVGISPFLALISIQLRIAFLLFPLAWRGFRTPHSYMMRR